MSIICSTEQHYPEHVQHLQSFRANSTCRLSELTPYLPRNRIILEGGAQQGCAEQGGSGGQAGGHELADCGVHGAVRRQAARLGGQLTEQVEALCTWQLSNISDSQHRLLCQGVPRMLNNRHRGRANLGLQRWQL